jgi:hypothetical protein
MDRLSQGSCPNRIAALAAVRTGSILTIDGPARRRAPRFSGREYEPYLQPTGKSERREPRVSTPMETTRKVFRVCSSSRAGQIGL